MLDVLVPTGSVKAPAGTLEYGNVGLTDCVFMRFVAKAGGAAAPCMIYTADELESLRGILLYGEKLSQSSNPGDILRLGALRAKPIVLRVALVHPNNGVPFFLLRLIQGRGKLDVPVPIATALELFQQSEVTSAAPPAKGTLRRDPSGAWNLGGRELHPVKGLSPGVGHLGEYLGADEVLDGEEIVAWTFLSGGRELISTFRTVEQWRPPAKVAQPTAQQADVALFQGQTYRCRQILKRLADQLGAAGPIEPIWAAKMALSNLLCDIANGDDENGHKTWLGNSDDPVLRDGIAALEAGEVSRYDQALYQQISCYFHSLGPDQASATQSVNTIMERLFVEASQRDPKQSRLLLNNWAMHLKEIYDGQPPVEIGGSWKACKARYPGRVTPKVLCLPAPHPWVPKGHHIAPLPVAAPVAAAPAEEPFFPSAESWQDVEPATPTAPWTAPPSATVEPQAVASTEPVQDNEVLSAGVVEMAAQAQEPSPADDLDIDFDDDSDDVQEEFTQPLSQEALATSQPTVRAGRKKRSKAPLAIGLLLAAVVGAGAVYQAQRKAEQPAAAATTPPAQTASAAGPATAAPTATASGAPAVAASGASTAVASASPAVAASATPLAAAPLASPAAEPVGGRIESLPPGATLGGLDPKGRYSVDRDNEGMKMLEQGPGWARFSKDGTEIVMGILQSGTIKTTKAKAFAADAVVVDGKRVLQAGMKLDQLSPAVIEQLDKLDIEPIVSSGSIVGFRSGEEFPPTTVALGQPVGAALLAAVEAKNLAGFSKMLNKTNADLSYMDGENLLLKLAKQQGTADYIKAVLNAGVDLKSEPSLKAFMASQDPAVVALMIKQGVPVDEKVEGQTKLFEASPEMTSVLLKGGADPNVANSDGLTPLFYASAATVPLLVKAGAKPNHTDREGMTALMGAEAPETKALLAAGVNPKLKDQSGRTALDHAEGNAAVTALLKKAK